MNPYFSICIPAYNAGHFLDATIESVLAQSFENFELLILDNSSTDDTPAVLSRYNDVRIRVVRNSETVPAHKNWTNAVNLGTGTWVKLLCADDLLKPNALKEIHDDLNLNSEVLIHVGVRDVIDVTGKIVKSGKPQFSPGAILESKIILQKIIKIGTNPFGEPMCVTWHRSLTERVGPFSSRWKYFIDLDYWLRLSRFSNVYYSSEILGSFRVSPGSWTSSIGFRTSQEAKDFFFDRSDFETFSTLSKCRALVKAALRTIGRQIFLTVVLRKHSESRK